MKEQVEAAEPMADVLEGKWLHKVMVAFHGPAAWPAAWVLLGILPLVAVSGAVWHISGGQPVYAWTACVILGAAIGGDAALLASLPSRQISFGPWKAQLFPLALPRTAAALAAAVTIPMLGPAGSLMALGLLQLVGLAALVWGAVLEPFKLALTEQVVVSDKLSAGTDPIRLLHITDLHIERLTKRESSVVELAGACAPDLILITGDYVNLSYNQDPITLTQVRQLLSQLSAPLGVFATLGSPPVDLRESVVPLFDGLPIHLMRHDWQTIRLDDGQELVIMGLDCTHHLPNDASRLRQLAAGAPGGVPRILLYHSPELMPAAVDLELDLYLCGHTHGGQVRLPWIGPLITSSQLGRQYVMGAYRRGKTLLYVSRGIGLEGLSAPRVRFLSPPEMTLFTLTSAEAADPPDRKSSESAATEREFLRRE